MTEPISTPPIHPADRSTWVNDKERTNCDLCVVKFNCLIRKHHCRICGEVFCSRCTKNRLVLSDDPSRKKMRICNSCYSIPTNKSSNSCRSSSTNNLRRSFKALLSPQEKRKISESTKLKQDLQFTSHNEKRSLQILLHSQSKSTWIVILLSFILFVNGFLYSYQQDKNMLNPIHIALLFGIFKSIGELFQVSQCFLPKKGVENSRRSDLIPIDIERGKSTTVTTDESKAKNTLYKDQFSLKGTQALDKVIHMCQDHRSWEEEKFTLSDAKMWRKRENRIKLLKVTATLQASAKDVFDVLYDCDSTPEWNSTLKECKVLEKIDDHVDITYTVAAEAVGGLVASRDFVNVRKWCANGDKLIISTTAIVSQKVPPVSGIIRGENGDGGFCIVPQGSNECTLTWVVHSDLKGWIPNRLIDQALSSVVAEFIEALRKRCRQAK